MLLKAIQYCSKRFAQNFKPKTKSTILLSYNNMDLHENTLHFELQKENNLKEENHPTASITAHKSLNNIQSKGT